MKMLSLMDLREKGIPFTRQHIHRLKQGKFPPPAKLGENTNAWPADEIDAYLKACIAKRDAASATA
jgi:predicted DNA-binding transcriptional regulator AlpA